MGTGLELEEDADAEAKDARSNDLLDAPLAGDRPTGRVPPLHTLPHDELLAKLRSLTNLRAVRDPKSSTGWTVELGPFPGWKKLPTW